MPQSRIVHAMQHQFQYLDEDGVARPISRKSYIHPALIDLCKSGQDEWRKGLRLPRATRYLTRYERGLIAFLEQCDAGAALPLAA